MRIGRLKLVALGAACAAIALAAGSAPASIWSPVSVVGNTIGEFPDFPVSGMIDQSALSAPFVSGVTDFDAYLAGNPSHPESSVGEAWFSPFGAAPGHIDFDLGALLSITRMALWNEDNAGVAGINVYTSTDSLFGTSTLVGAFTAADPDPSPVFAEVLDLADSIGRYVRLEILSGYWPGRQALYGINELAFDAAPLPPPQTDGAVPEAGALAVWSILALCAAGAIRGWQQK